MKYFITNEEGKYVSKHEKKPYSDNITFDQSHLKAMIVDELEANIIISIGITHGFVLSKTPIHES